MKESMWGYWLALLGIMVASVMILLQNYTTTNQQDYYLAREITYASMYDALDFGYYKKTGELRIVKEKFVENFIRRFAENVTLNKSYKVNFYDIYETPPAVSLEIKTDTGEHLVGDSRVNAGVVTRLTAILETKDNVVLHSSFKEDDSSYSYDEDMAYNNEYDGLINKEVYSATYEKKDGPYIVDVTHDLKPLSESDIINNGITLAYDFSKYKITLNKVYYDSNLTTNEDLLIYENRYNSTFFNGMPDGACRSDKCPINTYGVLSDDVQFSYTGNSVTWESWIKTRCPDSISLDDGVERCGYGIKYIAQWKYEYVG